MAIACCTLGMQAVFTFLNELPRTHTEINRFHKSIGRSFLASGVKPWENARKTRSFNHESFNESSREFQAKNERSRREEKLSTTSKIFEGLEADKIFFTTFTICSEFISPVNLKLVETQNEILLSCFSFFFSRKNIKLNRALSPSTQSAIVFHSSQLWYFRSLRIARREK